MVNRSGGEVKQQEDMTPGAETRVVPVRQWRIHVGAHKTATTHLQETLTRVRDGLAARGVDFIPNPLVREHGLARRLWERRPIARLPFVGPAHMRDAIEATVEPLRRGPGVVVLSEENILGRPEHIFAEPFYPQAGQTLGRLASLAGRADLVLFLSVRGYDSFLPSAYAERLKHSPPPAGGFEGMRARLVARPPSWHDLVQRIRAAAPTARLRIWRQEDYRANDAAIMETVCGCPLPPLPEISDPTWTRSPSASAIAAAERVPADLGYEERLARIRDLYAGSEPDGDRFRPVSAGERQRLRDAYAADLERIARDLPDAIMTFGPRELAA
jgi:hypothetical protein